MIALRPITRTGKTKKSGRPSKQFAGEYRLAVNIDKPLHTALTLQAKRQRRTVPNLAQHVLSEYLQGPDKPTKYDAEIEINAMILAAVFKGDLLNRVRRNPISENGINETIVMRALHQAVKAVWQTIGADPQRLISEFADAGGEIL